MGDYRRFSDRAARPKAPIIEEDEDDDEYESSSEGSYDCEESSDYEEMAPKRPRSVRNPAASGIVSDEEEDSFSDDDDDLGRTAKPVFDGTIPLHAKGISMIV